MKLIKFAAVLAVVVGLMTLANVRADDAKAPKPIPYPLKTCPVSDDKLGEMGDPYVFVYKGQEIKLCCSGCKKDFLKDPDKYLKKIKELAAKQKKDAATVKSGK